MDRFGNPASDETPVVTPFIPDNSGSMLPKRKNTLTAKYPKTSEARDKLIDETLAKFRAVCPVTNPDAEKGKIETDNMRANLALMSSPKLLYLNYSADPEAPLDDTELKAFLKKSRISHDMFSQWETDLIFGFFKRWLRIYVIESKMKVRALENVFAAVSKRNEKGEPILDVPQREMTTLVLSHFDWIKPTAPPVIILNPVNPGDIGASERKKFDELVEIARKNPDAAKIIEAMERARLERSGVKDGTGIGEDGVLKEAGEDA